MFERDYLMRILVQFAEAIRRSMQKAAGESDPRGAADMIEAAIGEATDIDGSTLLTLAPESMASVMQVSGVDPHVTEYIGRSLLLAASYLREANDNALADVREAQAQALADVYGFELPDDPTDLSDLDDETTNDDGAL